jgi:hypothetical protein
LIMDGGGLRWRRTDGCDATVFAGTAAMTHCPLFFFFLFPAAIFPKKTQHTSQSLCWRCWQKCAADVSDAVVSSQLKRKIMESTCEFKRRESLSLFLFPRLLALCPSIGSFWLFPSFFDNNNKTKTK